MSDIIERLRNRIHDAPMPAEHLMDEAEEALIELRTLSIESNQLAADNFKRAKAAEARAARLRFELEKIGWMDEFMDADGAKAMMEIARDAVNADEDHLVAAVSTGSKT